MKEYTILLIYSEELKRDVKVYVSLPESYFESDKQYPVLYMHDGQIIFNDCDDYTGTGWGILEKYKKNPGSPELILVGIASGITRYDELIPFTVDSPKTGKSVGGNSKGYMDFIVKKLKPLINEKYRTISTSENTGLLGISLGGMCSAYAAAEYTEHFKIFGCVSNAYNPIHKKIVELIKESDFSKVKKMYLDVGTNEDDDEQRRTAFIETNQEVADALKEKIDSKRLKFEIIRDSQHSVEDWNKRFPDIISYLFNE